MAHLLYILAQFHWLYLSDHFSAVEILPGEIQRQQMCGSRQFQFIGDAQLLFERDSRLPDVEMTL